MTDALMHRGLAEELPRRDFLVLAASALGAVGAVAALWPFVASLNPAADTIAGGAPIDVDLSLLQPGQQIMVLWRGRPVVIRRRTAGELAALQSPQDAARLADPASRVVQQPDYARNWHRSANPDFLVMVAICTHLGCLPGFEAAGSEAIKVENWPGGYFCRCHGSKYDLAGRVFRNVPAPYNLPVPPYRFVNDATLRIGENPPGARFDFGDIVQI
jgi:ubiquinol-cytochrome c reductase iron-sulfur subunit